MRRLEFAPAPKDMEVKDIKTGHFVFTPRPGKPVSLKDLRMSITKAGYEIESTWIQVYGTLTPDGRLRVPETGQLFRLEGEERLRKLRETTGPVTVAGAWKATDQQETILLGEPR